MTGVYERELKHTLEDKGFIVARAAGSLGTGDLWAFHPIRGVLWLIECKKTKHDRFKVSHQRKLKDQYVALREIAEQGGGIPWFMVLYAIRYTQSRVWHFWRVPIDIEQKWPVLREDEGEFTMEAV